MKNANKGKTVDFKELSDEELVSLSQNGDDSALEYLLKKYRTAVLKRARTYFLIGADHEDIVQEGMIGLFKAVRDFNSAKEAGFRGFAELCITRQMITAIKTATRQKHLPLNTYISLNRPLYDEEYEITLMDVLGEEAKVVNPEEIMINREQFEDIERKMQKILSGFERSVLNSYLQGKSYQEIAECLGRDAKSIDNALQRIKKKIDKLR